MGELRGAVKGYSGQSGRIGKDPGGLTGTSAFSLSGAANRLNENGAEAT